MEALRILEKQHEPEWAHDQEAHVLYRAVDAPRLATGIDTGKVRVVRLDAQANEFVGLTVLGLRSRLLEHLDLGEAA